MDEAQRNRLAQFAGIVALVIVSAAIAVYWIWSEQKQRTEAVFHGPVVEKYWRQTTRYGMDDTHRPLGPDGRPDRISLRRQELYIDVQTDNGIVDYELYQHQMDQVLVGDYIVKLPGSEELALFRDGRQLVAVSGFRIDPVPLPPSAPGSSQKPPPSLAPTPAPPKPADDAAIKGLLDQASQLWRAGEYSASIMASQNALTLTDKAYGPNSAQSAELRKKIDQAKKAAPGQ